MPGIPEENAKRQFLWTFNHVGQPKGECPIEVCARLPEMSFDENETVKFTIGGKTYAFLLKKREFARIKKIYDARAEARLTPDPDPNEWKKFYDTPYCRRFYRITGTEKTWIHYEIASIDRIDKTEHETPLTIVCKAKKNFGDIMRVHPYTDAMKAETARQEGRGLYQFGYQFSESKTGGNSAGAEPSAHFYRSRHRVNI